MAADSCFLSLFANKWLHSHMIDANFKIFVVGILKLSIPIENHDNWIAFQLDASNNYIFAFKWISDWIDTAIDKCSICHLKRAHSPNAFLYREYVSNAVAPCLHLNQLIVVFVRKCAVFESRETILGAKHDVVYELIIDFRTMPQLSTPSRLFYQLRK